MMRHRSRSLPGIVSSLAAAGAVVVIALAFAPLVGASHAGGADAFSIDMDPANAPANTATTLGSGEICAQINENDVLDADEDASADELQVDITATNLPPETAMIAFTFAIDYSASNLLVVGRDSAFLLNSNAGSSLFDLSDTTPDSDGRYYGTAADVGTAAPESGSGVLQRITVATSSGAATGEYALLLTEAAHVDSLNQALTPDALGNASVAVNQACGEGPIETPIPTATPAPGTPTPAPPPPGGASIGIDHNGGAPDINPGPAIADPNATVSVVAEAPPEGIGAWTVDVHYDPTVLSVVDCVPHGGSSVCNPAFSVVEVRFTGATATGLFGTVNLADITFAAVGPASSCSSLDLAIETFVDTEGADLAVGLSNGGVCVSDLPTPTPGPGVAAIGVDHDGGAPDINPGPAIANPNATVSVVAEAPPEGIGAWTVDVHFDPAVLDPVGCVPHPSGLCNENFSVIEVRIVGATASGLFGTVNLADITFAAVGSASSCSSLDLQVDTFVDPTGTDLAVSVAGGGVCLGGGPCEPAPANDDIANATPVGTLPFFDSTDTTCGTTAVDDPFCAGQGPTVWYAYTPAASGSIEANTFGSNYDTTLSVYTGAPGLLLQIACNDDWEALQSRVVVPVSAGETYFFMVGSYSSGPGGSLQFTVQEHVPLEIDVTVDSQGSVAPSDGVARVRGAYSCNRPAEMQIFGELQQRAGRAVINALFSTNVICEGYGVWEADAVPSDERFAGGNAEVELDVIGFTFDEVAFDEASGDVRLRGTKPAPQTRCGRDRNLGFESGAVDSSDIPCWTVASVGNGGWCTQAGALTPAGDCAGGSFTVAAPPVGAQAAMTNQGGTGAHVLYQCGVLRSGAISLQLYILNLAGEFASPPTLDPFGPFFNQQVRVDLVRADAMAADPFTTGAGDVLMNVYQSQPGDPVESGYSTVEADASAYVGEDLCLRVAEVDNVFFLNVGVDDVRISLMRSH